MKDVAFA
jgi:RNA recognition motif-containing protein